eukprot:1716590-Rhodomonas_salina.1
MPHFASSGVSGPSILPSTFCNGSVASDDTVISQERRLNGEKPRFEGGVYSVAKASVAFE